MKGARGVIRALAFASLLALVALVVDRTSASRAAPGTESSPRPNAGRVSRRAPPEAVLPPTQRSDDAPHRAPGGLARVDVPALASTVAERSGEEDVDELGHPHPITPRHRRIFEENNRLGALSGAMDQGDFAALRRMNAEYRRAFPEDDHDLQEGYDVIADCLEDRTTPAIEAARRFWQTHRASTLRRHVRRHCLEQGAADDATRKHAPE